MRIEDDDFERFRVRGLYHRTENSWRIKTWPSGEQEPEHDYWMMKGTLYQGVGEKMHHCRGKSQQGVREA